MTLLNLLLEMQATPSQWPKPPERAHNVTHHESRAPILDKDEAVDKRYTAIGNGSYRMLMSTNADGDSYEE